MKKFLFSTAVLLLPLCATNITVEANEVTVDYVYEGQTIRSDKYQKEEGRLFNHLDRLDALNEQGKGIDYQDIKKGQTTYVVQPGEAYISDVVKGNPTYQIALNKVELDEDDAHGFLFQAKSKEFPELDAPIMGFSNFISVPEDEDVKANDLLDELHKQVDLPVEGTPNISESKDITVIKEKYSGTEVKKTIKYRDVETKEEVAPSKEVSFLSSLNHEEEVPEITGYKALEEHVIVGETSDDTIEIPYIKKEKVVISYLDEEGKTLKPSKEEEGLAGDDLLAEPLDISGYELPESVEKKIEHGEDNKVEFIYKKPAAPIHIKYEDTSGKEIQPETVLEGEKGEKIKVDVAELEGYDFVKSDHKESITISTDEQTVKLIYKELSEKESDKGEEPDEEKADREETTSSSEEEKEETTSSSKEEKEETTSSSTEDDKLASDDEDKISNESTHSSEKGSNKELTGLLGQKDPKKTGQITIKYVDEAGKKLKEAEIVTGKVNRLKVVTPTYIKGYLFDQADQDRSMRFSEKPQTITLTYKKVTLGKEDGQPIIVRYVDEEGKEIKDHEVVIGKKGHKETLRAPGIEGYVLSKDDKIIKRVTVTDKEQEVTFTYKHKTEKQGQVVVKYVDAFKPTKELSESEIVTGKIGDTYDVSGSTYKKDISGYKFKRIRHDNGTGEFGRKSTRVVYEYEKIDTTKMTVTFETLSGKKVKDSIVIEGETGDKYDLNQYAVDIPGYHLVKSPRNIEGEFGHKDRTRKFIYTPNHVVVKHKILGGETFKTEKLKGLTGESYSTTKQTREGYHLVNILGNTEGEYGKAPKEVIYLYGKDIPGKVKVHYLSLLGKELAPVETLTGKQGTNYTTTAKEFDGFKLVKIPHDATGTFRLLPGHVFYVYRPTLAVPTIDSTVKVKYVDRLGRSIAPDEKLTGNPGESYLTSAKEIANYRLIKTPFNAEGTFRKGHQVVIYMYDKDRNLAGSLSSHLPKLSDKKWSITDRKGKNLLSGKGSLSNRDLGKLPGGNFKAKFSGLDKNGKKFKTAKDFSLPNSNKRSSGYSRLPQTGEEKNTTYIAAGGAIVISAGLIAILRRKNKKEDK